MTVFAGYIAFITNTHTHTHTHSNARACLITNHHMHICLSHFYFTIVLSRKNFGVAYFFCFYSTNLVMEIHETELWPDVV